METHTGSVHRLTMLSGLSFTMPVALTHTEELPPCNMPAIPVFVYGGLRDPSPAGLVVATDVVGLDHSDTGPATSWRFWKRGRCYGVLVPCDIEEASPLKVTLGKDPVEVTPEGEPAIITLTVLGLAELDEVITHGIVLAAQRMWPSIVQEYERDLALMTAFDPESFREAFDRRNR